MKKVLSLLIPLILISLVIVWAEDLVLLFKDEQGYTNWQYVANWSGGILIILLSITAVFLIVSRRATQKANIELEAMKSELEVRVQERTAELRASEHYIASILKSMPSMLVGLNENCEVTEWNQKAEQYTGIKNEDAIGKNLWQVYPIITVTPEQVQEAMSGQESKTIRQSQRGLFHFDITIYPLNNDGEQGVVLLLNDVSRQVESENKLIQRDKISAMGELASAMAHDINVPLRGMLENLRQIESLIPSVAHDSTLLTLFNQAESKGHQVSAIVENLLEFAQLQQQPKQFADVAQIMDHTLELACKVLTTAENLQFENVTIHREYDQKIPPFPCHVAEIQQVFLRLLRHSFHSLAKVTEDSFEPVIRIRILESYESIWVKISHNGVGLTGEEQQSIFEPYFSNQPLDSRYEADMRLSFSHFVVTEHHNGHMAVTSDPKIGTTFHMQFRIK